MTEDKFQQLVQNHPDLFEKAGDVEFSIDDGWFIIVDILCRLISNRLENAKSRLKYALENPDAKMGKTIAELEVVVNAEREDLPTLTQIKEKFGGLRFYHNGGSSAIDNYVSFAESMSYRTCEVCGNPGQSRNEGWIKVLCDAHHREREEKNNPGFYPSRKRNFDPKLVEEN